MDGYEHLEEPLGRLGQPLYVSVSSQRVGAGLRTGGGPARPSTGGTADGPVSHP